MTGTADDGSAGAVVPGDPFDPPGTTWTRVSPRLALVRRVTAAVGLLPLLVPMVAVWFFTRSPWVLLAVLVWLALLAWTQWLVPRQVAAIGYVEREDDLLVRKGILQRQVVVVPYGRMQYVDVQAGPVDRWAGIATVQLHTASAATDASIPGLVPAEAARLRDRLASRGEARLAGL